MLSKKELKKRLNKNARLRNKIFESREVFYRKYEKMKWNHKIIIEKFIKDEQRLWDKYYVRQMKTQPEYQSLGVKIRNDKIRLKNFDGKHTEEEWERLKRKYKNKCACCKKWKKLTKDHITPISLDGDNGIKNIQPLCRPCNSRKHATKIKYGE